MNVYLRSVPYQWKYYALFSIALWSKIKPKLRIHVEIEIGFTNFAFGRPKPLVAEQTESLYDDAMAPKIKMFSGRQIHHKKHECINNCQRQN